jgi:chromosomal replication initiation ATPase DnaA
MFEQIFETFRKTSESSLQMQQDMFKHMSQQSLFTPQNMSGASNDFGRTFQKHCLEMTIEILNKHRESLDSAYRSAIQIMEQVFRVSDAKSSEDYRRTAEEVMRKLFETIKGQSETQFGDLQKWTAKSFELIQQAAQ